MVKSAVNGGLRCVKVMRGSRSHKELKQAVFPFQDADNGVAFCPALTIKRATKAGEHS